MSFIVRSFGRLHLLGRVCLFVWCAPKFANISARATRREIPPENFRRTRKSYWPSTHQPLPTPRQFPCVLQSKSERVWTVVSASTFLSAVGCARARPQQHVRVAVTAHQFTHKRLNSVCARPATRNDISGNCAHEKHATPQ